MRCISDQFFLSSSQHAKHKNNMNGTVNNDHFVMVVGIRITGLVWVITVRRQTIISRIKN